MRKTRKTAKNQPKKKPILEKGYSKGYSSFRLIDTYLYTQHHRDKDV